ncbi:hypothetical protein T8K17_18705 [Thalassobaculum sp. OXR-137]|uniref:hypothetical protein n=1 Tax=Thalassobaculum sp. OXR-137 TaxID=3100173 RepID=UPI002AC96564|nr:hypothetical protein [Thalassobaculum sp. OXR-137]WPZ33260.1 hypothetical protein T8K17_18705 [Thalassobaculum sp. OXR-137]
MTLDDYLTVIAASKPDDWRATVLPTFMFRVVPIRASGGGTVDFELQEHTTTLTFLRDVRFGMAWGLVGDKNYKEEWVDKLPNKRAQGVLIDFLFNGAMVYRDMLVAVDGWRCILPQPVNETGPVFKVPQRRVTIAKLVHQLVGPETNFDSYFKRVGMQVDSQPWP